MNATEPNGAIFSLPSEKTGQEKTYRWRHLLSKASLPLLFCAAVVEGSLILEYGIKAFDSKPHIGHTIILSQFHVWDT